MIIIYVYLGIHGSKIHLAGLIKKWFSYSMYRTLLMKHHHIKAYSVSMYLFVCLFSHYQVSSYCIFLQTLHKSRLVLFHHNLQLKSLSVKPIVCVNTATQQILPRCLEPNYFHNTCRYFNVLSPDHKYFLESFTPMSLYFLFLSKWSECLKDGHTKYWSASR